MSQFKQFLSDKRIPAPAPEFVIDSQGRAIFGTFDKEIPNLNFLDIHKQSSLPDFMNAMRFTFWEACEVNFDEITLLCACSIVGNAAGVALTLIYDKMEKKVYAWTGPNLRTGAKMAPNLLDGAISEVKGPLNNVSFVNDFGNGKAKVYGNGKGPAGKVKFDLDLTRYSLPSVVNIPFGENKPLYSQKDLFTVDGYIEYKGRIYKANEGSTAIIDDHKGYYPYNSHYDWVTTMGYNIVDGKKELFGFNLTRNQSINQDDYNENLIWFKGRTDRVTPVKFEHINYNLWHITDDHGMVDITFDIGDRNLLKFNLGLVRADYSITFGALSGYICDEEGNKYVLDGMTGIGEDKTLVV